MKIYTLGGTMKIYILKLAEPHNLRYDYVDAKVVIAQDSREARKVAARTQTGDEGAEAWLDPARSTCNGIGVASGDARTVLVSFNAG